jgi:hypothetical protein
VNTFKPSLCGGKTLPALFPSFLCTATSSRARRSGHSAPFRCRPSWPPEPP